jgi:ribonuclease P protein component
MLQKQYRLPARVKLAPSNTFTNPFFATRYTRNNRTVSRFGFVVSKRVALNATVRNRLRRQLRSCIEAQLPVIPLGYDMLFIVRLAAPDHKTLCESVKLMIQSIH